MFRALQPRPPRGCLGLKLQLQGAAFAFPACLVIAGQGRDLPQLVLPEELQAMKLFQVQRVERHALVGTQSQLVLGLLQLQGKRR